MDSAKSYRSKMDSHSSHVPRSQSYQPIEVILINFFALLNRHKLIVLIPVILAEAFAIHHYVANKSYRAVAKLLVQKADNSSLQALSLDLGASRSQLLNQNIKQDNYLESVLLYLDSRDYYAEAAQNLLQTESGKKLFSKLQTSRNDQFDLLETLLPYVFKSKKQQDLSPKAFGSILKSITQYDKIGTYNFSVAVTTSSPQLSSELAQTMAEQAQIFITKRDLRQLEEGKNYIVGKLDELSEDFDDIEKEMLFVKKKTGKTALKRPGFYQENSELRHITNELEENLIKLEQNEKLIRSITKNLKKQSSQINSNEADFSTLSIIKRQLVALEARKKGLIAEGMSEDSAQVLALNEEIEKTRSQLPQKYQRNPGPARDESIEFIEDNVNPELRLSELRKENWLTKARINAAQKLVKAEQLVRQSLPEEEQKYYALNKRLEMKYVLFADLSKQLFNIDVSRISIQNRITLLEKSSVSSAKRSPTLFPLIPMTFILSLVFAALLANIIENFDPVIVTVKDFPGFNFISLGTIPLLKEGKQRSWIKSSDTKKTLIFRHRLELPETVPFKRIRTRLLHLEKSLVKKPQIISIHSTQAGDGKSFITGNLAASLASLNNNRVIIIDADLKKKALTREYAPKSTQGLSNFLEQSKLKSTNDLLVKNLQPNLDLFPAGPAAINSSELLNSPKFSDLLIQLRTQYDYILIDDAPFMALPDSEIVASYSDLVIIVTSANRTKSNDVSIMMDHFFQLGEKPICLLLNRTNSKSQLYYYYGTNQDQSARLKVA
jgi:capsular exopolysaccharide synthesis family protein